MRRLCAATNQFCGFMARPYGGLEVEFVTSAIELLFGLAVLFRPDLLGRSQAFWPIWEAGATWEAAVLWVCAGTFSLTGIWLFFLHNWICAPLRWVGGFLSSILWSWLGIFTIHERGSVLLIIISFAFATTEVRIMSGAWIRFRYRYG